MNVGKKVETLDSLQNLLNGEAIAVHMYDSFIPEVEDLEIKKSFQDIRSGHRRHIDQLIRRIEEMDHRPRIELNRRMWLSELMVDARTRIGIAQRKMIRWALKGEDMGLSAAREVTAGDLDDTSKELVNQILTETSDNVDHLKKYVH